MKIVLVGVRRTGAIQFIKVLLLYGTPTNLCIVAVMAAKKKTSSQPKPPVDITKIKGVTASKKPASAKVSAVKPGGKKVSTPNKGGDKGAFAGSGTPLGTSFAGSKLSKGNVAKTLLTVAAVPTKAAFAPASYGAKLLGKIAGRYGGAGVRGAADATYTSATKGLDNIRPGGRLYTAGTVSGKQLASTKVMNPSQVAGSTSGLVKRAENITSAAVRGGKNKVASQAQKDYNRISKVAREGLSLGAVQANKPKRNKKR